MPAPGRESPFLLRGLLPKGMSGDQANYRKPTRVPMPALRTRAECGLVAITPERRETRRVRHTVKNARETG